MSDPNPLLNLDPAEVEQFIADAFEQNYQRLALESGAAITPEIKAAAKEQVLLYYRRLREVAERVTETEVRLTLPEQVTPAGRRYTLEGVVDIVQELGRTVMYDVKTHFDADTAQGQLGPYTRQLNVYAHIWQGLRGQPLDATAIIATRPVREVRSALRSGDPQKVAQAVEAWNPLIDIPLNPAQVEEVIFEFGEIVDRIEERDFAPPPVEVLLEKAHPKARAPFGTEVCRNCDVRFSCNSFRQYAVRTQAGVRAEQAIGYYLSDYGLDFERSEWQDANMETLGRNGLDDIESEGAV